MTTDITIGSIFVWNTVNSMGTHTASIKKLSLQDTIDPMILFMKRIRESLSTIEILNLGIALMTTTKLGCKLFINLLLSLIRT